MGLVEIQFTDEEYERIKKCADQFGVTPDQFSQIYLSGYVIGIQEATNKMK